MASRDKLWAISLVKNFLKDNGLEKTLNMLYEEAAEDVQDLETTIMPTEKPLMAILDDIKYLMLKQNMDKITLDRKIDQILFEPGDGNIPKTISKRLSQIHYANILSVLSCSVPQSLFDRRASNLVMEMNQDGEEMMMETYSGSSASLNQNMIHVVMTGSADKTIKIVNAQTGACLNTLIHHSGPVLCMAQHPEFKNLIVTGGMEGKHYLVDVSSCEVVQSWHDHAKYVVKVLFSTWDNGRYMVSASFDKTVNIYERTNVSTTRSTISDELHCVNYVKVHTMTFRGTIESLCFVPAISSSRHPSLVVGVREDNYLHYIEMDHDQVFPYTFYNMNANGDDWVSFTPMDLSVSPNGKHLVCYTDSSSGRLIIFRTHSNEQILNLYGPINDEFAQPRCVWDPSGKYIYATSGDDQIWVFELSSGNVVHKLKGHEAMIRALSFDYERKLLISCSYDKSVILWT